MGLTQFFFNNSRNNSVFNGDFNSLKESFSEIENQCVPFYYKLARFVATTLDREVALEKGFVFNEDGEPEFSKKIYGKTDEFLRELCEVNDKTLRNWRNKYDVSINKREERKKYFKLAFKLNLDKEGCNTMFNKLFGSPAFIREPETLIYLHCLDNSRDSGFGYADELVNIYNQKIKTEPAKEVFERMYTENIYNYPCKTEEKFVDFLVSNRKQFEIANLTAISKIESICQKYIKKDYYTEKLKKIEELFEDCSVDISDAWSNIESFDESPDENESKHSETTRAVMECFPLFLSVLAKDAPDEEGKLMEMLEESVQAIDASITLADRREYVKENIDYFRTEYARLLRIKNGYFDSEMVRVNEKINGFSVEQLTDRIIKIPSLKEDMDYDILRKFESVSERSAFVKVFDEELNVIDIKNIDSYFFKKAFLDFPSLKLIYDEKLNDPEFSKFKKYENLRKLLIMMSFLAIHTGEINGNFSAYCNINLAQCGFGELYAPNPFDFMFLIASNAEKPIDAFRTLWDYAFSLSSEE